MYRGAVASAGRPVSILIARFKLQDNPLHTMALSSPHIECVCNTMFCTCAHDYSLCSSRDGAAWKMIHHRKISSSFLTKKDMEQPWSEDTITRFVKRWKSTRPSRANDGYQDSSRESHSSANSTCSTESSTSSSRSFSIVEIFRKGLDAEDFIKRALTLHRKMFMDQIVGLNDTCIALRTNNTVFCWDCPALISSPDLFWTSYSATQGPRCIIGEIKRRINPTDVGDALAPFLMNECKRAISREVNETTGYRVVTNDLQSIDEPPMDLTEFSDYYDIIIPNQCIFPEQLKSALRYQLLMSCSIIHDNLEHMEPCSARCMFNLHHNVLIVLADKCKKIIVLRIKHTPDKCVAFLNSLKKGVNTWNSATPHEVQQKMHYT